MAKTAPFDAHPDRYDDWFDRHEAAYQSELRAIRALWPGEGDGLEVGIGTGRFAAPLGIECRVDPSPEMRKRARERDVAVRGGVAEDLPVPDARFDAVLLTTALCYLDDPEAAFKEAFRVLRPGGALVVGFIDRDGPLGQRYERNSPSRAFWRRACSSSSESLGYQTNLFVYGPGGYEFADYVRVGGPLQLLLAVVTTLGIVVFWGL